jgi:predicted Zn-dependent peptidase
VEVTVVLEKNINKFEIADGVDFIYIKSDKFKTFQIYCSFFVPLEKHTVSEYAILAGILECACKKFPNFIDFNKHLEKLYGASIDGISSKIGDYQVISISAEALDDRFTFEKCNNIERTIDLFYEVIFKPLAEKKKFEEKFVEQSKRFLIEHIESEKLDKKTWALLQCERFMCENQKSSIPKYGYINDLKKISSSDAYSAYENMLKKSRIELLVTGNLPNEQEVFESFKKNILKIEREKCFDFKTKIISEVCSIKEKKEKMEVEQCKLVMGFRTGVAGYNSNFVKMMVFCSLLGGIPTSKLFLNVREKLNLCYYCSAKYDKSTGNVFIESGVSFENIDKARTEIFHQIDLMKNGNISEEEIDITKKYLIQRLFSINDKISTMSEWYANQFPYGILESPEEFLKKIQNINLKDIISCAKQIQLDTVYVLTGKNV